MAVPDTIFGIKPDSIQKILESVTSEPKLQALLLVALHYFAGTPSKAPACAPTSSDTSPVYDPSTNSPTPKRPVRSKIEQFVAGKRTPKCAMLKPMKNKSGESGEPNAKPSVKKAGGSRRT